ncbi:MAG: DUF3662 and FHA domain-containing protein [Anaerolineae bacterium]|jgi:hypothetical protein|nr:DUF3662 and FHA domain-containing protein [Anaerolineae bacterium]
MDANRFSRFEERIQALVEGGFARLFAGRLRAREVALRLARAMEDEARQAADGRLVAPNYYEVHLHPDDRTALLNAQPDLAAALIDHVICLAQESGLRLDTTPQIDLAPDQGITPHSVMVIANHAEQAGQSTEAMDPVAADRLAAADQPPEFPAAFLVVDGTRYVPLDRTVINIGRRRDNLIVLDDPHISRQHCQLRFRFGEFVLYDLGSRGGTLVNDQRVSECVLRSGDVISLAGVKLVYMVEEGTTGQVSRSGDTQVQMRRDDLDEDGGA